MPNVRAALHVARRFNGDVSDSFEAVELRTERLLLRPYLPSDAEAVLAAANDETIQRWLPLPSPYTIDDARFWTTVLAPGMRERGEGIEWAATRLDTGDTGGTEPAHGGFVGSFGIKRVDWRARTGEIGYWVGPWARGANLATEAVRAIARWFLVDQRFERLELRAAPGNLASRRVAEKAGFTREGVARNAGFIHAGRVDLVIFSLIRADLDR